MKFWANNIVLRILGMFLLMTAVSKGHELLITPMANMNMLDRFDTAKERFPKAPTKIPKRNGNAYQDIDILIKKNIEKFKKTSFSGKIPPWIAFNCLLGSNAEAEVYFTENQKISIREYIFRMSNSRKEANANTDIYSFLRLDQDGPIFIHSNRSLWYEEYPGQFLWIIAECGISLQQIIIVNGEEYSLTTLLKNTQKYISDCGDEMCYYESAYADLLPIDSVWVNKYGEQLTLKEMMSNIINRDITGSPDCIIQHLIALAKFKNNTNLLMSKEVKSEMEAKLKYYINLAKETQLETGEWEVEWIAPTKRYLTGPHERVKHTARTLQWLFIAMPRERLDEEWILKTIRFLCKYLEDQSFATVIQGDCFERIENRYVYGVYSNTIFALKLFLDRKEDTS